jgi:hypothetical protein
MPVEVRGPQQGRQFDCAVRCRHRKLKVSGLTAPGTAREVGHSQVVLGCSAIGLKSDRVFQHGHSVINVTRQQRRDAVGRPIFSIRGLVRRFLSASAAFRTTCDTSCAAIDGRLAGENTGITRAAREPAE